MPMSDPLGGFNEKITTSIPACSCARISFTMNVWESLGKTLRT